MAVTWTVLGSGSKGNCTVLATARTQILIDAGFSCRETFRRMQEAGLDPRKTDAILISHEHSDHVNGMPLLARRLDLPVYMTAPTHAAWKRSLRARPAAPAPASSKRKQAPAVESGRVRRESEGNGKLEKVERFEAGRGFTIGDIDILPFTIPMTPPTRWASPLAEGRKLALVTDLGYFSANVVQHVQGSDLLMIESNHDLEMLRTGPYPWAVKQRVLSRVGHLSNDDLAQFFGSDYDGKAAHLILAHLSEANNHPELARRAAERALGNRGNLLGNRLALACQTQPLKSIRM